jgi:hypothetical protein
MKTVTLVGCGNIGVRHLQALLNIKEPLNIQVMARSAASLNGAKDAINNSLFNKGHISIEWHTSIDTLRKADLCIIATTAIERTEVLLNLLERDNKRFLIEKLVCQSDQEYLKLLEAFSSRKAKGWVNCYRRYYPFYRELKDKLKSSSHIIVKITGGNHGLGCNAIHYVDLFCYLKDSPLNEINGDFLDNRLHQNRRSDKLVEFSGTLIAKTPDDSFLDITFTELPKGSFIVSILGKGICCVIDEWKEKAQIALASEDWKWHDYDFENLLVSRVTTDIVTEIMDTSQCALASLEESYTYHRVLFDVFNKHIHKLTGSFPDVCPIT